jgi:sugar phosphate isomerase/epimerase
MDPEIAVLQRFFNSGEMSSDPAREFVARKLAERDRHKSPHLEALLFSLDALVHLADRYGVLLGLENRAHYHELPGQEDFALFFKEFDGGPLGYWHDTGHAHLNEALGTCAPGGLLRTCGQHLIGLHLHDAQGLADHLPAGTGEIDFKALEPFLSPAIPRVIELAPGTPDADVDATIRYFRENVLA